MFKWIDTYSVNRMSYGISNVLIMAVLKGLLMFAIVYGVLSRAKRLSPSHRHLFWLFALASCLLAPAPSYIAIPVRSIDPAFITEERSSLQGALSAFFQWFFPFKFKTVWQMERGSYFCIDKVTWFRRLSWESWARCRVRFAWGVFHPTIFLPEAAERWPRDRLRAVLTHELAVREGTKSADYAGHLLALARSLTRRDAFLAGIFLSRAHKSSLERRVVSVLAARGEPPRRPLTFFARPLILCVVFALPLLLLNPAVGEAKRVYIDHQTALQRVAGVWINREYGYDKVPPLPQKYVVTAESEAELWGREDNIGPSYRMDLKIVQCWMGREGCLYCNVYQIHHTIRIDSSTELWRVDRTGRVLETMYRGGIDYKLEEEFPEKIDPTPDPRSPDNYAVWDRE